MQDKPGVSIFIVTYITSEERCEVLRQTCEVALRQNYFNFEVVVSDNAGPFSAVDALAPLNDPRLKVVRNEENKGFAGNMNRCLELCTYDIIKPCCDDDLIHPDFLSVTLPLLEEDLLVITDMKKFPFGEEPAAMKEPAGPRGETEIREPGYRPDLWSMPYEPWVASMLFHRSLCERVGGFDGKTITSDWDFIVEVALYFRILHLKQTLSFIGEWPESLTVSMQEENPFFYPRAGLYTRFRLLKNKSLQRDHSNGIRNDLMKDIFMQSLRPLRHPLSKVRWKGYFEYVSRFRELSSWRGADFSARPHAEVELQG